MTERSRTKKLLIAAIAGTAATAVLGIGGAAYALADEPEPTPEYVQLVDSPDDESNPGDSPGRTQGGTEWECDRDGSRAQTADRT